MVLNKMTANSQDEELILASHDNCVRLIDSMLACVDGFKADIDRHPSDFDGGLEWYGANDNLPLEEAIAAYEPVSHLLSGDQLVDFEGYRSNSHTALLIGLASEGFETYWKRNLVKLKLAVQGEHSLARNQLRSDLQRNRRGRNAGLSKRGAPRKYDMAQTERLYKEWQLLKNSQGMTQPQFASIRGIEPQRFADMLASLRATKSKKMRDSVERN